MRTIIRKGTYKKCERCETPVYIEPHLIGKKRFCSILCLNRTNAEKNIGRIASDETKNRISVALKGKSRGGITMVDRVCKVCLIEFKTRKSYVDRGNGIFCSVACRGKWIKGKPFSPTHLANISGPNASNWQGGLTSQNQIIRHRKEYSQWRKAVYTRDGYTCVECRKVGGTLNAHHIKPFSLYPELRHELSNGVTLCLECHVKTDTFGSKIKQK